jgi:imidazolonepropionase
MKADLLIRGISQLVTAEGPGPKHGAAMRQLKVIEQAALAIADGTILWVGPEADWNGEAATTVDAQHRAVVPGLVDPHTHAVWAGDRLADFEARISGVPYERILASGGGIWSTILAGRVARACEAAHRFSPAIRGDGHRGEIRIRIQTRG